MAGTWIDWQIKSFAFRRSCLFTTTVWHDACITANVAPKPLFISHFILPLHVKKTLEYLNSFTSVGNLSPREETTLISAMASDLEVLILILGVLHLVFADAHRLVKPTEPITSLLKAEMPGWGSQSEHSSPRLHLEILYSNITTRI